MKEDPAPLLGVSEVTVAAWSSKQEKQPNRFSSLWIFK